MLEYWFQLEYISSQVSTIKRRRCAIYQSLYSYFHPFHFYIESIMGYMAYYIFYRGIQIRSIIKKTQVCWTFSSKQNPIWQTTCREFVVYRLIRFVLVPPSFSSHRADDWLFISVSGQKYIYPLHFLMWNFSLTFTPAEVILPIKEDCKNGGGTELFLSRSCSLRRKQFGMRRHIQNTKCCGNSCNNKNP